MSKKKPVHDDVQDLVVSFSNVSVGDKTARIGVSIDRSLLKLAKAEQTFCEKRLRACLVIRPNGSHPNQGNLPGMEEEETELETTFDVKRISFTADEISFGLTGALESLDVSTFAKFAKRVGRLIVNEFGDIPEEERKPVEVDDE